MPPYIVSAVWAVGVSYFAWKYQKHGIFIAASTSLSVIGYIMFIASSNPQVLYGASFLTFTGARRFLLLPLAALSPKELTDRAVLCSSLRALLPRLGHRERR